MPDKEEWDDGHYRIVKTIYGMVIGTALVVAGIAFTPHVLDGGVTWAEFGLMCLVMLGGLVAALPGTFMQIISWGLQTLRRRNTGA